MVAPKAASAFTMDCRMPIYDLQLENPDSETTSQSISKLHDVYSRKLSDVETCSANQVDLLENRQKILQSYVDDLRKLNSFLVETLQEFEKESRNHVELLESRLIKTASSAKDYVCKVCDLEHDLLTAINDKKQAVESEQVLCDQLKNLDYENNSLQDRNANLRHDIQSLIKIIQSFRHTGSWQIDNVTFCEVTFDEVYGSPRYSSPCSSRGSYSNIVGQRQDTLSKSFTLNLNKCSFDDTSDTSASFYKDCTPWFNEYNPAPINPEENFFQIIRLKSELRSLLMQNENLQSQLCERNCVIAELESKVTELNHEVLVKAAEVEYCRSISDIHCDSKQSSQKSRENSYCDVTLKTDLSVDYLTAMDDQDEELQMQENRDSNMSLPKFVVDNDEISSQSRIHLESFCDANLNQIYDDRLELNSQLDDALEKIKYLEAQISKLKSSSHESLNALTAEIVERHDIIHRLKQEKQLEKDKHKETSIRLQFFGEIIKDLRKKNHDDRFRYDNRQRTDVLCQNCLSTIEKASVVTDCDAKEESLTTTGDDLSRYSSDEAELRDGDSESSAVSKVERDQWHLKCRYGACFNDNSNDDANTRSEMSCKCENITSSTMDSDGHFGSPVLEEICSQELPPWPASTEDVSVQTVSFDEHDVMISAKIFNDRGAQTNNKLFSELCGSSVAINQEQPDVLQESFAKDDKAPQLLLKIHSLQEDLTKAKDEGQSKNMLIAQLQMHLKTVVNELELKDVTLHNIETKLDNVRQDNELFRSKLASITDQMEIFQNKVDVGQEQNANLQIQLDAKVKEIEELIEAENTMLEQKRSLMIQLDTRGSELLATTDDNTLLITKLEEKTLEIENLKLTVQNFQKAVIHEKKMSDDMKKLMKQKEERVNEIQENFEESQDHCRKCFDELMNTEEMLNCIKTENLQLKDYLNNSTQELENLRDEVIQLNVAKLNLEQEKLQLQEQATLPQESAQENETKIKELEEQLITGRKLVGDLHKELLKTENIVKQQDEDMTVAKTDLAKKTDEIERLETLVSSLREQLIKRQDIITNFQEPVDEPMEQIHDFQRRYSDALEMVANQETELGKLGDSCVRAQKNVHSRSIEMSCLQTENENLKDELDNINAQVNNLKRNNANSFAIVELMSELVRLKSELEDERIRKNHAEYDMNARIDEYREAFECEKKRSQTLDEISNELKQQVVESVANSAHFERQARQHRQRTDFLEAAERFLQIKLTRLNQSLNEMQAALNDKENNHKMTEKQLESKQQQLMVCMKDKEECMQRNGILAKQLADLQSENHMCSENVRQVLERLCKGEKVLRGQQKLMAHLKDELLNDDWSSEEDIVRTWNKSVEEEN